MLVATKAVFQRRSDSSPSTRVIAVSHSFLQEQLVLFRASKKGRNYTRRKRSRVITLSLWAEESDSTAFMAPHFPRNRSRVVLPRQLCRLEIPSRRKNSLMHWCAKREPKGCIRVSLITALAEFPVLSPKWRKSAAAVSSIWKKSRSNTQAFRRGKFGYRNHRSV